MSNKNQHVVPCGKNWAVRGAGNTKVTSIHETQKSAINAGIKISRSQKSELFIHRKNGQIRDRNSYGDELWLN